MTRFVSTEKVGLSTVLILWTEKSFKMAELDSFMGKFLTWNNSWSGMANMMGYALVFSVNLMGEKDQKHEDNELHG